MIAGLSLLAADAFAPEVTYKIPPASIQAEQGDAFIAALPDLAEFPFYVEGSSSRRVLASRLVLLEDGLPLGPANSLHADIRRDGRGEYSHWGNLLFFSSSDGTDPRKNGRVYTFRVQLQLQPLLEQGAVALLLLGIVGWLVRPRSAATTATEAQRKASKSTALVLLAAATLAVALVSFRWNNGRNAFLGFIGYLPISDAIGYFRCAVRASGLEVAPEVWCSRRIAYVTGLGALMGASGWRPQIALVVQAVIVSCAIATFALAAARFAGRLGGVITLAGLFVVAYELAFGNFVTEVFGLAFGLLGLTLLLGYAVGSRPIGVLYFGLALVSVGMVARMGAMLALPLLGLWACVLLVRGPPSHRVRRVLGAIVALATGPVLQLLLVSGMGGDLANSGGNYAATLYGLSTGSRAWPQAYKDFDAIFSSANESTAFSAVFDAALANIRANPRVFATSLWLDLRDHVGSLFAVGVLSSYSLALTVLGSFGVVWCAIHARLPTASLILAVLLGELLSAPLVITNADDFRVLATTFPVRPLLVGVGTAWIASLALGALKSQSPLLAKPASERAPPEVAAASILGALLLIATLLPLTPLVGALRIPIAESGGCALGEREVVSRVGRESMAVLVGRSANPITEGVLGVLPEQLLRVPSGLRAWWVKDLPALPPNTTLIYAIQLMANGRGSFVPLVFTGDLRDRVGRLTSFCYDPAETSIRLSDFAFHRVLSIRAIAE